MKTEVIYTIICALTQTAKIAASCIPTELHVVAAYCMLVRTFDTNSYSTSHGVSLIATCVGGSYP